MAAATVPRRRCREPSCIAVIEPSRRWRDFCCNQCRRLYQHRNLARGAKLYAVAMQWRHAKRSHIKGAKNPPNPKFGEMTNLLDEWKREDRAMRTTALAAASP